jgi:hypothetical protein
MAANFVSALLKCLRVMPVFLTSLGFGCCCAGGRKCSGGLFLVQKTLDALRSYFGARESFGW